MRALTSSAATSFPPRITDARWLRASPTSAFFTGTLRWEKSPCSKPDGEREVPLGRHVVVSRVCRTRVHPANIPGFTRCPRAGHEGAVLDLRVRPHTLIPTHSRSCTLIQAQSHAHSRVCARAQAHSHVCVLMAHALHVHSRACVRACRRSRAVRSRAIAHMRVCVQTHTPAHSHTCGSTRDAGTLPAAGASAPTAVSRDLCLRSRRRAGLCVLSREGREEAALGDPEGAS